MAPVDLLCNIITCLKARTFYENMFLATLSAPIFITGDFNTCIDRLDNPFAIQLNELLASLGLSQHVDHPTHDLGGILDVVLTRSDQPAPRVSIIDVGLSDVKFTLDLRRPPLPSDYGAA